MRLTRTVGLQIARARDVFCIPVAIFVRRLGEPDGRRLALSEISRCRLHKSTVDTAVGRAYALTRVQRGFGRRSRSRPASSRRAVSLAFAPYTYIESNLLSDYFDGAARP